MCHVIIKSQCGMRTRSYKRAVAPLGGPRLCRRPPWLRAPTYVKNYTKLTN